MYALNIQEFIIRVHGMLKIMKVKYIFICLFYSIMIQIQMLSTHVHENNNAILWKTRFIFDYHFIIALSIGLLQFANCRYQQSEK